MSLCERCIHFRSWSEPRPYGSTTAYEHFEDCNAEADEFYELGELTECRSFEEIEESPYDE
jgi:hypothetical protein